MRIIWRTVAPLAAAVGSRWRFDSSPTLAEESASVRQPPGRADPGRKISEAELRRHNRAADAWVSFHGVVYDITRFVDRHPPAAERLDWANRVAGRRFEHFLGRDAFGPMHGGCGPDANCCSKEVRAKLERVLEPYRIGQLQSVRSPAAERWPHVGEADVQLNVEDANGRRLITLNMSELRESYPRTERVVTHKCSTTGKATTRRWAGVHVRDLLLPLAPSVDGRPDATWDPLVTFVGMDGFGYSMFRSRAMKDDVILAYEQGGDQLDCEGGGPLRLVKDGQHAKWVETIIVE